MVHRIVVILLFSTGVANSQVVRIKDLVNIKGYRNNQLIGYGLVVGLAGTGDSKKSMVTNRGISNLLKNLGMQADSETVVNGSAAGVVVTGNLTPFAKIGDQLDIRVSVIGDATSLQGGTLIQTALKGGDNQVYAIAQGVTVIGKANGSGVETHTTALLHSGGIVEREFSPLLAPDGAISISLKEPDFTNNSRITKRINAHFKGFFAESTDPAQIVISLPPLFTNRVVDFVAELESLQIKTDLRAVVVMNEKTGTLVMGKTVMISPIVIAHGQLSVAIGDKEGSDNKKLLEVNGTTVGDLVDSLNALGVTPSDLVSILQAVKSAGALRGDLEFM